MRPSSSSYRSIAVLSFAFTGLLAAFGGCAQPTSQPSTTSTTTSTTTATTTSSSGTGGTGGIDVHTDGGTGGDGGNCTYTEKQAEHIQLDMIFVIDQSDSMAGTKWLETTTTMTGFFNDAASAKIGAGLLFFPNHNEVMPCIPSEYAVLDVPINTLPANAFPLTNAFPAEATGNSTPTWGAMKGALLAATAYQDAHPKDKVVVVLVTDGDPNSCGNTTNNDIAILAKSARNYNGVLTYVIGVSGSIIENLDKIAVAGGTNAAYDITHDISEFAEKMKEIRSSALGCAFDIPKPPPGEDLDPNKVNFTYTPKGVGDAKVLLRADDLADCKGQPGWYYDSNLAPTKILLCPASCSTVQNDPDAKVTVLFGCISQVN
ncbi:MAG: VWA domain-containing protein [Byssovorax sp.]